MATKVRGKIGQFTADTSTFDVTVGGGETRTPTGLVVFATNCTALDTSTADLSLSYGVTDFTNTAVCSASDEHGQPVSDAISNHASGGNIIVINTPGTATIIRSATVTAIPGGATFTPIQTGSLFRIECLFIFGSACHAFSAGATTVDTGTFNVTHNLATAPGAGIYFYNDAHDSNSADMMSVIGFHSDNGAGITQICHVASSNNGDSVTTQVGAKIFTGNVAVKINPSAATGSSAALTTNAATTNTYTVSDGTQSGDLIGLLIECDDINASAQVVDTPTTAASDWTYSSLAFQPQAVVFGMSFLSAVDTGETGTDAGVFGAGVIDETTHFRSVNFRTEDNITLGTTNTASQLSQAIELMTYNSATATFDLTGPVMLSNGWVFLAEDIAAADSTVRKWPSLAFETSISDPITITVPTGPWW